MKWFKRVHLLYLFGFFANFRPANPFVYEYYVTYRKLPAQEVRQDILPTFSYSTVIQLVFVFFFSEFCHYNPFIVISAISAIVATCVRTWTSSVFEMEVAEVTVFTISFFLELLLQPNWLITSLFIPTMTPRITKKQRRPSERFL
ncbi:Folate carrier domain containing protein [Asbolus verrucosus]|uniref:Folate carrier domain containing protein n=1 Tax=Asbolus verrucosus TaxID=1661398 RepID=A0A482W6Q5_ASBVE|nr:Folate carrier domain containing protein [Asbolus verrucosus]